MKNLCNISFRQAMLICAMFLIASVVLSVFGCGETAEEREIRHNKGVIEQAKTGQDSHPFIESSVRIIFSSGRSETLDLRYKGELILRNHDLVDDRGSWGIDVTLAQSVDAFSILKSSE